MFGLDAFSVFLQRVSVEPYDRVDLNEALGVGNATGSPFDHLVLTSRWHVERSLALVHGAVVAERISPRPIHDGYIASLEIDPRGAHDEQRLRAFVARERERAAERWVRDCYGEDDMSDDIVFRLIDYPAFDTGSGEIGFGLASTRDRAWLWSRFEFAHK